MMRLTMLGTGTLIPEANKASSAILVTEGDSVLPIDLGRNSLSRMVEAGVDPLGVGTFLVTHLHPDHSCELVSLLFGLRYGLSSPRESPVRLIGPVGLARLVESLQGAWPWLEPSCPLEIVELESGPVPVDGFEVEGFSMHHGPTPALGFRVRSVNDGVTLAFTGDTGPGPALDALSRGVDVLVAECAAFEPALEEVHLTAEALAAAATSAEVGRLVVTHLYPQQDREAVMAAIRSGFDGPVLEAFDGMTLDLRSTLAS